MRGGAVRNLLDSLMELNYLGFYNRSKSCVQRYVNWKSLVLHNSYSTVYFSAGLVNYQGILQFSTPTGLKECPMLDKIQRKTRQRKKSDYKISN